MIEPPWWKRLPRRFLEEDRLLRQLSAGPTPNVLSYRWLRSENGMVSLRVTIPIGDTRHELEVSFPHHYPIACPAVRPIPADQYVSTHQFRDGVLCLEFGPDNWHPDYSAAHMILSAQSLLLREEIAKYKPTVIPSRHVEQLSERVQKPFAVLLLRTAEFEEVARSSSTSVRFSFTSSSSLPWRIMPIEFPVGRRLLRVPPIFASNSPTYGRFIVLRPDTPLVAPNSRNDFNQFVKTHGGENIPEDYTVALLRWSTGPIVGYLLAGEVIITLGDIPLVLESEGRLSPQIEGQVSNFTVGIVGLGSLGSKVAVSLARTGVRKFVLVDHDVLLSPNVSRHAADYSSVGRMKVDAVKDLLLRVCDDQPAIKSTSLGIATAAHPTAHSNVLAQLAETDVIIDCTADPEVFSELAMQASALNTPMVWGEVFGGGLGGFVASAHPESDPCPTCVRRGFHEQLTAWGEAPNRTRAAIPYAGAEDIPLTATDADVAVIAGAVVNRTLDVLGLRDSPTQPVTVIGLRKGWVFDEPMGAKSIRIRRDDYFCEFCWKPLVEPDGESAAAVESLFSAQGHAEDPPAT